MPRQLLFSKFWLPRNAANSSELNSRFVTRGGLALGEFFDALVFDEKVFFPTSSYSEVGLLIQALGTRNVFHLLETERLKFVFVPGGFGANGRQLLQVSKADRDTKSPTDSWSNAEAAVESFVSLLPNEIGKSTLKGLLTDSSQPYDLQSDWSELREVTQTEFERSLTRVGRKRILSDVSRQANNQITVFDGFLKRYPSLVSASLEEMRQFQLAYLHGNIEARIAAEIDAADVVSSSLSAPQLFEKAEITKEFLKKREQVVEFKETARLPQIGLRVVSGEVPLASFFDLISSIEAHSFRQWFAENANEQDQVREAYLDLLHDKAIQPSAASKAKRIALELVMSFVPGASYAESAFSKFIFPMLSRDSRVLLFLDRYRKGMFATPAAKKLAIPKYL